MYKYQIYNLKVESDVEIPSAAVCRVDEKFRPDVRLCLDPMEEAFASLNDFRKNNAGLLQDEENPARDPDSAATVIIRRHVENGREIFIEDIGFFRVTGGSRICCRFDDAEIYQRDQWLLNYIFTELLVQRKELIFHGSAVRLRGHDGMILITGMSGSGKSTLTDTLLAEGADFVSDDSVLFRPEREGDSTVWGYGAYPLRRLLENSVGDRAKDALIAIEDGRRIKYGIRMHDRFSPGPHRLESIWLLQKADVPEVEVRELAGAEKLRALHTCIYQPSCYAKKDTARWMMQRMLAIAGVKVYTVTRPEHGNTIRRIRDVVLETETGNEEKTETQPVRKEQMPKTDPMAETAPQISLIVPVYNMEKWLPDFFAGLDRQHCESMEILLVDDGSTDGSGQMLKEYAAGCAGRKDRTVRVIRQENRGLSGARNTGLAAAKGKWIAFTDPDDWLEPDFLSAMLAAGEQENADVVICHERSVEEDAHPSDEGREDDLVPEEERWGVEKREKLLCHFQDDFAGKICWCCNKLYRSELIGDTHFAEGRILEDIRFNAEVLSRADRAVWVDRRLFCYRQQNASICHKKGPRFFRDFGEALLVQNHFMEQTGNQELIARNYAFCLGNLARLGTQASGLGYRREAEELDKSYREMYEKAKGCLKGRAVIKAMGYRYMKRCYRMYLMRRLKSMEKENGGMRR